MAAGILRLRRRADEPRRVLLTSVDAFRQPILAIRWTTTVVGSTLAAPELVEGDMTLVIALAFVVAYTIFRTFLPIESGEGLGQTAALTFEAGAIGIAVAATGYFSSPIAFSLLTAVSAAGFLSGLAAALRLATATALAIGIPSVTEGTAYRDDVRLAVQWAVELFLVSAVAAFARRILTEADEAKRHSQDQMARLTDANQLLSELHQVAQNLPASLDLREVLDSTVERLRALLRFDWAAVVLHEESDGTWTVARRHGARLPTRFSDDDLPRPLRLAVASEQPVMVADLPALGQGGLSGNAGSGAYARLQARGQVVGVVVVERASTDPFQDRDAELLAGFVEPAALAIDNARWFSRLRTVGAEEERTRIARDLHDRIGQSLAYLAFEMDRLMRSNEQGRSLDADLPILRQDLRNVIRDVRETLYDLRTDVTDERTIPAVLAEFAQRIEARSGIPVAVRVDEERRLPLQQERELWRILQEALVNAERHSGAERIEVYWHSDGANAVVEVRDDGSGLPASAVGKIDSYGMLGMRERADSIGAHLAVESVPQRGVTVRATLRVRA